MADLFHECGIAAVYQIPGLPVSRLVPGKDPEQVSRLIPRLLLDIQNRGQLAAGMTSYNTGRKQLLDTHKDVGTVAEVFHLNHPKKAEDLISEYLGPAAIGHVRYATCGKDDKSYAQPFERHHIQRSKWFSFGFNGQLANYPQLRSELLEQPGYFHLVRETDTEILMHLLSQEFSPDGNRDLLRTLSNISKRLDGAYNLVFMNAMGDMFVSRDPLGIRPLCFAQDEGLFVAASESVALANLGFHESSIRNVPPGHAVIIQNGEIRLERYADSPQTAHCFFEWIYFANVASTLDEKSVYLTRKRLGEELAFQENVPIDSDSIVVPVPDTAKAAASSMAYELNIPCLEGLMRNRYVGRTFITADADDRQDKVRAKYTPLHEVMRGKRVFLVEDTIVRSTTMRALIHQIRDRGEAREVHVRVACPPIVSPCFYGIDMSTVGELFAPNFMSDTELTPEIENEMAEKLGADSLRYLPIDAISRSIELPASALCQACVDTKYPTEAGRELYQIALTPPENDSSEEHQRTFDSAIAMSART